MRLFFIRSKRNLQAVWHKICAFYFRNRLKWQFKGKTETFENYLKFQDTLWHDKFTWENPDPDLFNYQGLDSGKSKIEEFRELSPVPLMDAKDKKTVRQTIKDSILELKNMREMGLPQ
jgi:hypothetical protein